MSRILNLSRSFFIESNVSTEGNIFMNVNSFLPERGIVVGHAGKGVPLMLKK